MSDCPRCKFALQTEEYEGAELLFCATCWGHWLDPPSLEKILSNEVYQFSDHESESVFQRWANAAKTDKRQLKVAICPVCRKAMTESVFADDCPVMVDRCPEHGVWLDTTEIKQLQVYVEKLRG